jgi:hypothetical protein
VRLALITPHAPGSPPAALLDATARDLARAGHAVALLSPDPAAGLLGRTGALPAAGEVTRLAPPGRGAGGEEALAGVLGLLAPRWRPEAALVEGGDASGAVPAALAALRVPFLFLVRSGFEPGRGLRAEARRRALRASIHAGGAVVVEDPARAAALGEALGVEEVAVLPAELDLEALPLVDRARTRTALGLSDHLGFVGLATEVGPSIRLELAALAHRHLPGVGLLVAAHGAQETLLPAMAAATRPSSPVLHLGPCSPTLAAAVAIASDVCLSVEGESLGADALSALALGRRVALLDVEGARALEGLYPGLEAVHVAAHRSEDLRRALEAVLDAEARLGPLPRAAVEQARHRLGPGRRALALAELLPGQG